MDKHTVSGEPVHQKNNAEEEGKQREHEKQQNGEDDDGSDLSDDPDNNAAEDVGKDVGSGLGHTAEAFARAPMDLSLAMAQGFHNTPRLYGDTAVRR